MTEHRPKWLPEQEVKARWPKISKYSEGRSFVTHTRPFHESTLTLYGMTEIPASDLQMQILEAAYDGRIIDPGENKVLNFGAFGPHRLLSIEYPLMCSPTNDSVPDTLLRRIKEQVQDIHHFERAYFMRTSFVTGPKCHPCFELYVGNMKQLKNPRAGGKERHVIGENPLASCEPGDW